MVKDFDQNGHKDRDYVERKSWKYFKDQSDGQNGGKANSYRERHDAGYRQQLQGTGGVPGLLRGVTPGTNGAFMNRGQKSEIGGRTGNFNGNIQKDRKQGFQAYEESRKEYEGGSCTSGFGQNPDMDQYTPPTDVRAMRQRDLQRKCQERLFPGTETMMQNKEANSVLSNQLESIDRITSGLANATRERMKHRDVAKLNVTEGLDATPVNKIQTVPALETKLHASGMVHAAHEITKHKDVADSLDLLQATRSELSQLVITLTKHLSTRSHQR